MGWPAVLDVIFGLVFIFFVFSLLASGVSEAISRLLDKRSRFLEAAIWRLIGGEGLTAQQRFADFWNHPLVEQLARPAHKGSFRTAVRRLGEFLAWAFRGAQLRAVERDRRMALGKEDVKEVSRPWNRPTGATGETVRTPYIPAQTFAVVVLDLEDSLPEGSPLKSVVESIRETYAPEAVRAALEQWFDGQMERVSGWYKREAKSILVGIGILVVVLFNVDTIAITRALWAEPTVRELVARTAERELEREAAASPSPTAAPAAGARSPAPPTEPGVAAGSETSPATRRPSLLCDTAPTVTGATPVPDLNELEAARECARKLAAGGLPIGWPKPTSCQKRASGTEARTATECKNAWDRVEDAVVRKWREGRAKNLVTLVGWTLSVGALSMGAPFWWDQLNRLGSLRSAGPRPAPSSGTAGPEPAPPGNGSPSGPIERKRAVRGRGPARRRRSPGVSKRARSKR